MRIQMSMIVAASMFASSGFGLTSALAPRAMTRIEYEVLSAGEVARLTALGLIPESQIQFTTPADERVRALAKAGEPSIVRRTSAVIVVLCVLGAICYVLHRDLENR